MRTVAYEEFVWMIWDLNAENFLTYQSFKSKRSAWKYIGKLPNVLATHLVVIKVTLTYKVHRYI